MEKREYVELRSEEVQEILGTPPGWLVQWGTFVVFAGVAALLAVASIISYPDVVEARISITPSTPSVDVVANADGQIALFLAHDSLLVREGQVLAVLRSAAQYDDVRRLDANMAYWLRCVPDSIGRITPLENLQIGELQAEYAAFVQAVDNYRFGKRDKSTSVQRGADAVRQQIAKLEQSITVDQKAMRRVQTQMSTAKERYQRQRDLFDAGAISRIELERERQQLDDLERQYDALEDNILRKQNEITGLDKSRRDAAFSEAEGDQTAVGGVRQTLGNLQSALERWKRNHLVTAPIPGRVSLNANIFLERQYVRQGQQLLVIIPPQSNLVVGRLLLPVSNSGKVRSRQRVIIKLDSYPYSEFGILRGYVNSKSLVPVDDKYTVSVLFPDGLKTNYGKDIPFEQQLEGGAEIITDEKRLLQRIYEQVFAARR